MRFILLAVAGVAILLAVAPDWGVYAAIGLAGWLLACVLRETVGISMPGVVLTVLGADVLAVTAYGNYLAGDDLLVMISLGYHVALGAVLLIAGAIVFAQDPSRRRERRYANVGCAVGAIVLLVLWSVAVLPLTSSLRRARVAHPTAVSDFPVQLQRLLEVADQRGIDVEPVEVFCVARGLYEEYYWQTKATPELIEWSITEWTLSATDEKSQEVQYFWRNWPSSWHVPQTNESEFFVSSTWAYTEYGVTLMHDKTDQRLYFWYMSDF